MAGGVFTDLGLTWVVLAGNDFFVKNGHEETGTIKIKNGKITLDNNF